MGLANLIKTTNAWIVTVAIILVLVLYDLALGWWGSIPPKRPNAVPPNAVFVFAPAVGFILPLPKRGDWLHCWLDREHNVNRCRMSDTDGSLEYEGVFSSSEGSNPAPEADLQIDVKATGTRLQWIFFQEQIIPIIHLHDGTILVPLEAYDAAKEKLKLLREHQHS